jgi:diguanylate cyclase (GGDEF)-like protein
MAPDAARLGVLHETRLLDSPPERAFDRLTRLASGLIGAPTALVSLVDERRQFFKSAIGLGEPWASKRETPLSHSFCQYVVKDKAPLVVEDARKESKLATNGAVADLGAIAYAGMPLVVHDQAVGALCVIDSSPRKWSAEQLQVLSDLAESVVSEIELRLAFREVEEQRALVSVILENLGDGVVAVGNDRRLIVANQAARKMFTDGDGAPRLSDDDELARALRREVTDGLEFSIETPSHEAMRIEASARPVYDESGELIAAVGVYRDTTAKHTQNELYSTLARSIPSGAVMLFDRALRCIAIDGGLVRREGLDRGALVGRHLADLARVSPDAPAFADTLSACERTFEGEVVEVDLVSPARTLHLRTAPVRDVLGKISSGVLLAVDVTAERRMQNEVRNTAQLYRAIAQNLPDAAVVLIDRELRFVTAEGAVLERALDLPHPSALVGKTVREVTSPRNLERVLDNHRAVFRGETRCLEIARGDRFFDTTTVPLFDGDVVSHALMLLVDVSKRKAELLELEMARRMLETQAQELREASVTDSLTGLLNRRGFSLLAEKEIKAATRAKRELLLFFVDLNGMKTINDVLGHAVGDEALAETAKLLRSVFREADVIARLGGDEFVVLATDAVSSAAPAIASRIESAVNQRNASASAFELSLSVGVALFEPAAPCTLDQLLSQADARMYAEKQLRGRARRGA